MCDKKVEDVGKVVFHGAWGTESKFRGTEGDWTGKRENRNLEGKHKESQAVNKYLLSTYSMPDNFIGMSAAK